MKALQSDLGKKVLENPDSAEALRRLLCGEGENEIVVEDTVYHVYYKLSSGLFKI